MQANLLKAEIVANEKTIPSLADEVGIKPKTMYNKINGQSQFTVDEVKRICSVLRIEDPVKKCLIFLT